MMQMIDIWLKKKNPECSAGFVEGLCMEVSDLMGLPINSAGAEMLKQPRKASVSLRLVS